MTSHAPIPVDSIVGSIPDLMAGVRVAESARAAGIPMRLVERDDWAAALVGPPRPAGAVVDLTADGAVARIAAAVAAGVPVLAYGPHVDLAVMDAAAAAGAVRVVPRGQMMQQAGRLLAALVSGAAAAGPPSAEDRDDAGT
ncbi:MAG: hypothetical protein ABI780_00270 [Ardenticatenales bacterium]